MPTAWSLWQFLGILIAFLAVSSALLFGLVGGVWLVLQALRAVAFLVYAPLEWTWRKTTYRPRHVSTSSRTTRFRERVDQPERDARPSLRLIHLRRADAPNELIDGEREHLAQVPDEERSRRRHGRFPSKSATKAASGERGGLSAPNPASTQVTRKIANSRTG